MRALAMNYAQLMNQASTYSLGPTALLHLRTAHDLAQRLVDGVYRKEGSPFICHLIRTASIVMDEVEGKDTDAVAASMLHAVYFLHYFKGSRRRGPRKSDREFLREQLGERAERLLDRYGKMPWNTVEALSDYASRASDVDDELRVLLLMQLSDELEDHLDNAAAYAPKAKANQHYQKFGPLYVELALKLGHERLADDLKRAFKACEEAEIHDCLLQTGHCSYELRNRLWTANLVERLGAWLRRVRAKRN
ncbi:MAG: HD domain-containing protein [Candidatus Eremiobacteraeota bacterium]|nr:HD domain-containing protein [Candidatus Eremiobacteraeota bacterium]